MRLAIELANTAHARQGTVCDELQTPADLAAWLTRVGPRCAVPVDDESRSTVDLADLAAARGLRAAIRAVAGAASTGRTPDPADLDGINSAVRAAPHWRELAFDGTAPRVTTRHGTAAITGALAEVAADAVDLLSDGRIAACAAPGCVLLFLRDRPNREWCSNACGNRARVARHHDRRKQPAPKRDAA
ncbi:CGNR zinc finger domain-containing protein [Catellatospora sichuanensis]|uniref:CGNR zinc finger domain-containing protein n=1 Tax=Catellatospora sichuanensis TaxID=1969805 RepID=UPI001183544B|nr:CGNR zinc finger domain-containing protein [Catellatospora sichuanensis]